MTIGISERRLDSSRPRIPLSSWRIWRTLDSFVAGRQLVPNFSKHQGGVRPAEPEGVRQRDRDRSLFGLERHQVNRCLDRWIVEIDRRRRDLIANGKDREDRLDRTR